jgi:hypothetical protein
MRTWADGIIKLKNYCMAIINLFGNKPELQMFFLPFPRGGKRWGFDRFIFLLITCLRSPLSPLLQKEGKNL